MDVHAPANILWTQAAETVVLDEFKEFGLVLQENVTSYYIVTRSLLGVLVLEEFVNSDDERKWCRS